MDNRIVPEMHQFPVVGGLKARAASAEKAERFRTLVLAELERVLESPAFRNSVQSQRLLRHVVALSLESRVDDLRERAIGVHLFGREAGFDTSEDPIVRVRANEVRKRLSRYYEGLAEAPPVRFELHAGSYRVEFRPTSGEVLRAADAPLPDVSAQETAEVVHATASAAGELPPIPQAAPGSRFNISRSNLLTLGATVACAIAIAAVLWFSRPHSPIDQFWEPLLTRDRRIIVCIGHPVVYRFSTRLMQEKRNNAVSFLAKQTQVLDFKPGEKIDGADVVPIEDQYIGLGSAHATAQIASWLARHGRNPELRFGGDLSFTELKESPAVLVSFANLWTMDFMKGFRFVAELDKGRSLIRDQQTGKAWALAGLQDNGKTDEDYVLVSRTFYSESGQCLITVAGLTQYGTQSAGEIVTNPVLLEEVLAGAGENWQRRNLQLLFHVRVVQGIPGPPKLLATHVWD